MITNQLKLTLISQKNEAVDSLVNGTLTDLASVRYLQGQIHRIDATLLLIKQLEGNEDDE
jgi:hypothetical protein